MARKTEENEREEAEVSNEPVAESSSATGSQCVTPVSSRASSVCFTGNKKSSTPQTTQDVLLSQATLKQIRAELKARAPPGLKYYIGVTESDDATTIADIMRRRKRPQSFRVPDKRRLDTRAKVVTQEDYIQLIEKKDQAKKQKGKKKE